MTPPDHGPRFSRTLDAAARWGARASAATVCLMLLALVVILARASWPSITTFGAGFFTTSEWRPNELERPKRDAAGHAVMEDGEVVTETVPPSFGALPVVAGTAASSALALLFAVPLGLGAGIFLVRVAPRLRITAPLSFLVEFLAAIPSLAYGLWALFVLAPFLQRHAEPFLARTLGRLPLLTSLFRESINAGGERVERELPLTGRDLLAGGIVLAVMILPIITAVARDVLRAVPRAQVEGTVALGATWWQSARAMLRYARAGLFGAVMLGLARAAGETMAVTMVIGNSNRLPRSPFAPAQTMSSLLANEFAEASTDLHRSALLEVALTLLVMSLLFNIIARRLVVGAAPRPAH